MSGSPKEFWAHDLIWNTKIRPTVSPEEREMTAHKHLMKYYKKTR